MLSIAIAMAVGGSLLGFAGAAARECRFAVVSDAAPPGRAGVERSLRPR
jgi:hypothetical protein